MSYRQAVILAVFAGLAIGIVAAFLAELHAELEFARSIYAATSTDDDVAPADISALHEEARRITGDAAP